VQLYIGSPLKREQISPPDASGKRHHFCTHVYARHCVYADTQIRES